LIESKNHFVKICDFGSAKMLQSNESNVSYICSRFYRAPELIFGSTEYTFSIDTWSLGCVIAELLIGHPLFPGESSVDQMVEIVKILGSPSKDDLSKMNPNYDNFKFPDIKSITFKRVFREGIPSDAIDLIQQMLRYNP